MEKVIITGPPRKIQKVNEVIEDPIQKYIDGFNPLEKIAYEIAKIRLKTSFDIEKSIGFKSQNSR